MRDEFEQWLLINQKLSKNTVANYSSAINFTSSKLKKE